MAPLVATNPHGFLRKGTRATHPLLRMQGVVFQHGTTTLLKIPMERFFYLPVLDYHSAGVEVLRMGSSLEVSIEDMPYVIGQITNIHTR